MTPKAVTTNSLQSFERRFKSRLQVGLSLARVYRFVAELEPVHGDETDPITGLGAALRAFRRALREEDPEAALDEVERTWAQIEACRQRVIAHDVAIQAYRVRWACENAPLRHQTIGGLAHFYRLLPFSTNSQSKYEYVLTRLLAGPICPERQLAPAEELIDTVVALENSWGAKAVAVEESEVAAIILALQSFAHEAIGRADVATFTASALLRRFGAFKVSLREKLFDSRVSVAVVEANVAVLNVLNQLLTDAGSQPLTGTISVRQIRQRVRAQRVREQEPAMPFEKPEAAGVVESGVSVEEKKAEGDQLLPDERGASGVPAHVDSDHHSGQIDVSGLAFRRHRRDESSKQPSAPLASLLDIPPAGPMAESGTIARDEEVAKPPVANRPDLRTAEVDLSGLEFIRLRRGAKADQGPESELEAKREGLPLDDRPSISEKDVDDADWQGAAVEASALPPPLASSSDAFEPQSASDRAPAVEEQQPSLRAFDLGKLEENAALIEKYLAWPRSPEVWQLDLDNFLRPSVAGAPNAESPTIDKRRALELILASDDLICVRATQEGASSAEHRAKVKLVANAMLLLRTSLRRAADLAQGDPRELEPLLYVSDHLLWERLRLEASLKRNLRQKRPPLLPRKNQAAEATLLRMRLVRRHRRILIRAVGLAAAVTALVGMFAASLPRAPVDREVALVKLEGLPGAQLFDDARSFRSTLFVSAGKTWPLLGKEERRSIVRALATFAADRGFDTVSMIGPQGETLASFKDDEVILAGELTAADLAKR